MFHVFIYLRLFIDHLFNSLIIWPIKIIRNLIRINHLTWFLLFLWPKIWKSIGYLENLFINYIKLILIDEFNILFDLQILLCISKRRLNTLSCTLCSLWAHIIRLTRWYRYIILWLLLHLKMAKIVLWWHWWIQSIFR